MHTDINILMPAGAQYEKMIRLWCYIVYDSGYDSAKDERVKSSVAQIAGSS